MYHLKLAIPNDISQRGYQMLGQGENVDSGISWQIFSSPDFGFGVSCEKSGLKED